MASLTDEQTLMLNGYSFFPEKFSADAYTYIFKTGKTVLRAYGITFFVTAIGTVCNVCMTVCLSYPLARPGLKGRNAIAFFVFFTMLFNGGLVPTYIMYSQFFHIRDTIFALLIPSFLMSPFNVILMRNYFKTNIPDAIIEAAKLDGASHIRICWQIVMPNVKPAWLTLLIFAFQGAWQITGYSFIYNEALKPIPTVMQQISAAGIARAGVAAAAAVITMLPPIIVFIFCQSSVMETMATSGLKD